MRRRARNQKLFEFLGVPDLVKSQPQKPEAVGGGAPGVGVSGDPALGPDLDRLSRNLKTQGAAAITRLFFLRPDSPIFEERPKPDSRIHTPA